jgi:hypothetical protein
MSESRQIKRSLGAGAESSGVQVDVEGLLMSAEFLHGCHLGRLKFAPES